MKKKQTLKVAKQSQLDKKMDDVALRLYNTDVIREALLKDMVTIEAPVGSLIVAPHTMSKKEFDGFRTKWISIMEKYLKSKRGSKTSNELSSSKNWDSHGTLCLKSQPIHNNPPKGVKRTDRVAKQSVATENRYGKSAVSHKKPIATTSKRAKSGASKSKVTTSRNSR
jgi:hypothetical protein